MIVSTYRGCCAAALVAAFCAAPAAEGQSPRRTAAAGKSARELQLEAALRRQTAKVTLEYCQDVASVAAAAAKSGLKDEAEELLKRIQKLQPDYKDLQKLETLVAEGEPATGDDLEAARKAHERGLARANEEHAKRLYKFAEGCFRFGLFSRSYDLLLQVLELAPDPRNTYQKRARQILGYVWDRESESWITEWEANQKRTHVLTEEGWVPKKDLPQWEKGMRPYKGQWVSIDREREIRSRNEFNPYRVESENFEVLTNLGRKEAWEYAELLEDFHRTFYRFFVGYYDQVAGAKLLFRKADRKSKYKVYLFPSREDYLIHVKSEQGNDPLLRKSAGFYSHGQRISRFFWTENIASTLNTLYHEVAHQLFAESKATSAGSSRGNNWVVEGIATYVETWEKVDGAWHPGGKTDTEEIRMAKAFLAESKNWSLSEFVRIDHDDFHKTDRSLNYAISGALCHFFLHYDDEVYKEDFIHFLSDYYGGKVAEDSLADYITVPEADGKTETFAALEKQFREYTANL